jgi:hypothetical protein
MQEINNGLELRIKYELRVSPEVGEKLSTFLHNCEKIDSENTKYQWYDLLVKELGLALGVKVYQISSELRIATISDQESPEIVELFPFVMAYSEETAGE